MLTAWWRRRRATCLPGGKDCSLGHNDWQDRLAPARLGREQFGGGKIVFVATGGAHTVALARGRGAVGVGLWSLWPAGSGRQR
jgi:hypothetical protein